MFPWTLRHWVKVWLFIIMLSNQTGYFFVEMLVPCTVRSVSGNVERKCVGCHAYLRNTTVVLSGLVSFSTQQSLIQGRKLNIHCRLPVIIVCVWLLHISDLSPSLLHVSSSGICAHEENRQKHVHVNSRGCYRNTQIRQNAPRWIQRAERQFSILSVHDKAAKRLLFVCLFVCTAVSAVFVVQHSIFHPLWGTLIPPVEMKCNGADSIRALAPREMRRIKSRRNPPEPFRRSLLQHKW